MKNKPLLVIEHCEPGLSEWLLLEYQHASTLWPGDIVFTNIHDKKTASTLQTLGIVERKNANDAYRGKPCIILDPQAKKPLTPKDCSRTEAIIVGGILGYEEPKGRTKKLLSDKSGFLTRHLGPIQLSIDGAVFVVKAISEGLSLEDIEIAKEIEIVHDNIHSTILPFGYPVIDDVPMVTPGLVEYLVKR